MASKPRKAFDGIARPQGFIDDAAKAVIKVVTRGGSKAPKATRGQMYTKALKAEKRLKQNVYGKQFGEYNMTSMAAAKKQDRADVAAFMKKTKRSMKKR
jgi:hypothetical protein